MIFVLSPAKTLDFETPPTTRTHTQPEFLDHSAQLIALLRKLSPADVAALESRHLDRVLALAPEIILLGTGSRLVFPPRELMLRVQARGVGMEVMDTGAACRTFNVLLAEDRVVVALLLLGD